MKYAKCTDLRRDLAALLDSVAREESVILTRRGQPVARLVPFADGPTHPPPLAASRRGAVPARRVHRGDAPARAGCVVRVHADRRLLAAAEAVGLGVLDPTAG